MTNNLNKFYHSLEEVINFFRDHIEMLSDASYKVKQNKTEQSGTGLKILTAKQMFQRFAIALAQGKAGKKITKKVYNNIVKSIQ